MEFARVVCIAPDLSDELLAKYRGMIDEVPEKTRLREVLEILYKCATEWWNIRESNLPKIHAISGVEMANGPTIELQKLDKEVQEGLWDHIPWMEDIQTYEAFFASYFPEESTELKALAYHLSWLAKELHNDREPITVSRIVR